MKRFILLSAVYVVTATSSLVTMQPEPGENAFLSSTSPESANNAPSSWTLQQREVEHVFPSNPSSVQPLLDCIAVCYERCKSVSFTYDRTRCRQACYIDECKM